MGIKKLIGTLLVFALVVSGCNTKETADGTSEENTVSDIVETTTDVETETSVSETEALPPYEFNPHVYSPKLSAEIPQDHWDSLYNLCDALRVGDTTFKCSSQEAYDWATDSVVLAHLFPAACMKVTGESNDGTVPYEDGVGRIYYQIPVEDFVKREAEFEEVIVDILNNYLEPDDTDFEKCLKLYDYMASNYTYEEFPIGCGEGAYYYTIMNKKGVCDELSTVYCYLLMQVDVDAMSVGCFDPDMCHAWAYVILDGQGYHVDPTWALKYDPNDPVCLEYFMMTDEHRINDGCPVDDLTVDLLPQFWDSKSDLDFPADDDRYSTKDFSTLERLDEENKILYTKDMYGNVDSYDYD